MNARKEILEKIEEFEHYKIECQKELSCWNKQDDLEYYERLKMHESFYDSKISLMEWVLNLLKAEDQQ